MNVVDFYNKSEYSKIDFGSNPTLFTKKELLDFANKYLEAITVTRCCGGEAEQLKAKIAPTFDKYLLNFENKDMYGETMWLTGKGLKTKESMMQMYEDYITSL